MSERITPVWENSHKHCHAKKGERGLKLCVQGLGHMVLAEGGRGWGLEKWYYNAQYFDVPSRSTRSPTHSQSI